MTDWYVKALSHGQVSPYQNVRWEPGVWLEAQGPLSVCGNGLHVCRHQDVVYWLQQELWWCEVEPSDDIIESDADHKMVVRRARVVEQIEAWNDRTARLFAADCAEAVLYLFEARLPGDDRPRLAIEATRAYARGEIGDAAMAAARDAAWDAAWGAASDAAWGAAWDAAWGAAWVAAWDAARVAARDAARVAARVAARDAASAAARDAQTRRLWQYLNGEVG